MEVVYFGRGVAGGLCIVVDGSRSGRERVGLVSRGPLAVGWVPTCVLRLAGAKGRWTVGVAGAVRVRALYREREAWVSYVGCVLRTLIFHASDVAGVVARCVCRWLRHCSRFAPS